MQPLFIRVHTVLWIVTSFFSFMNSGPLLYGITMLWMYMSDSNITSAGVTGISIATPWKWALGSDDSNNSFAVPRCACSRSQVSAAHMTSSNSSRAWTTTLTNGKVRACDILASMPYYSKILDSEHYQWWPFGIAKLPQVDRICYIPSLHWITENYFLSYTDMKNSQFCFLKKIWNKGEFYIRPL